MSSSEFQKRYIALNKKQKQAVDAIEGPVVVIAGPGSGKTELLSLRVANMIRSTDTLPQNILCLTFTDSGAVAMRKRLYGLIGERAYHVPVHTFHSFSIDIIERFPHFFYDGAFFSPADEIVQREVLQKIFENFSHDNPLKKEHPEQGYIFLSDTHKAIEYLKKGGLTSDGFRKILSENEKSYKTLNRFIKTYLSGRVTKKDIAAVRKGIRTLSGKKSQNPYITQYTKLFADSLTNTLNESKKKGTSSLSLWKTKWTSKDEDGVQVLKDFLLLPRLQALQEVYREYTDSMYRQGYIDFDDMLLNLITALEKYPSLLSELRETYQYILVDEFQDTNDAQMRLISLLIEAPVSEGRPNIMVVGDDDQAIFKFQGAEAGNFISFIKSVRNPSIITLSHNYRSTPEILDTALSIIRKGEYRLEKLLPTIHKDLTSCVSSKGEIIRTMFENTQAEYSFIAREVKRLFRKGIPLKGIAIIGRKHEFLEALAPYLYAQKIPVSYERQQNVLKEPHIYELIVIAKFLASVGRKNMEEADEMLPEILSFPFWEVPRVAVWNISVTAGRKRWLEVMRFSKSKRIRRVAEFLIDTAVRSLSEPLEYILDDLIGSHVSIDPESNEESKIVKKKKGFVSPFRDYYFSRNEFTRNRTNYLVFLSSLRVFIGALREHKKEKTLKIDDLVSFVGIHKKNGISLTDKSLFVTAKDAVSLLTAHKAKGLEFEAVFILHCHEKAWAGKGQGFKLPFPKNLSLVPPSDSYDDHIRLFYVSLTRAKKILHLLSHITDDNGKETRPLAFLEENSFVFSTEESKNKNILTPPEKLYVPPFVKEEKALLQPLLDEYVMSVTHLNNYLNILHGGPQFFLEQNLLRFPQAKALSSAFGTAMHSAIEKLYRDFRKNARLPNEKQFLRFFVESLEKERLSLRDYTREKERGEKALSLFYKKKKKEFLLTDRVEVNFRNQGVVEGDVPLSGKIDKMVFYGRKIEVYDFKTGKVYLSEKGKTMSDKIQLRNYMRQLAFYKILVEGSRDFSSYKVKKGVLEFLEPVRGGFKTLLFEIDDGLYERTRSLIKAVYKKIMNMQFPDVSRYKKDINGIIDFENDVLKETKEN